MRIESNKQGVLAVMNNRIIYAHWLLGHAIKRTSLPGTPLRDHYLRANIQLSSAGTTQRIAWTRPYAAYQERGMRADGSHVVKNYTTAGTGPWFAKNAVKAELKNIGSYYKQANEKIR